MEAHPPTNKEAPLAARRPVPPPTNQAPNDRPKRDRRRERRDQLYRKRMKVLNNAEKLAFREWKDVLEPWTYKKYKKYIEGCHVGKAFNQDWYLAYRLAGKANLKFYKNPDFLERCIHVYQYLFNKKKVEHNEVNYKLCHMVWAEIALEKKIDWHSYGVDARVTLPPSGDIPRTCKYPNRGLGIIRTTIVAPSIYDTTYSSDDSGSDGANLPLLSTSPSTIRNRQIRA